MEDSFKQNASMCGTCAHTCMHACAEEPNFERGSKKCLGSLETNQLVGVIPNLALAKNETNCAGGIVTSWVEWTDSSHVHLALEGRVEMQ